jgi:hypothetical protein
MSQETFGALAAEVQDLAGAVVAKSHLPAADLRHVLSFIAKVTSVAEQAFQDVVSVLVDIKLLTPDDLASGQIREIMRSVELLTLRSRYRDAEEICSRLHHLGDQYRTQIQPLLRGDLDVGRWGGVFGLINEHEGRLIMLVHHTTEDLRRSLERVDAASLPALRDFAAQQLVAVRDALDLLRELSNKILGLSGNEGLLELTATGQPPSTLTSIIINRGTIAMSRDHYEVGQAGAVGPNAHAHDMTLNQVWDKSSKDIDLARLGNELVALRDVLSKQATDADHFVALGTVAAAEKCAKIGDGPGALQHLKKAGAWVWDTAVKVGIGVATAAAKTALGI